MVLLNSKNVLDKAHDCRGALASDLMENDSVIILAEDQGSRFPDTNFPISVLTDGVYEIILISSRDGDILTIDERAYNGSTLAPHTIGDGVYHFLISKHITELQDLAHEHSNKELLDQIDHIPIDGKDGAKGDQGERGLQGVQGIQGIQGVQGEQGEKGNDGEKGEKGDQGLQGTAGQQGEKGEKGEKGDQGIQGVQGVQGADGRTFEIIGTVATIGELPQTGNPGEGYIVSADGDLYAWLTDSWDNVGQIVGPQGSQGTQGVQGPQGQAGSQGIQGEQGPQGIQGPAGNAADTAALTHAATSKDTPADEDEIPLWDNVSGLLNKLTWANLKATAKTYFDTIYTTLTAVKADTDIADAISKKHASGSDNQDLSGLVTKVTGSSLVADTEIAKIHALHADDQDLSGLVPNTRTVNSKQLNANITLTASDVGALPSNGTADKATILANARNIGGTSFNGSADIEIGRVQLLIPTNNGEYYGDYAVLTAHENVTVGDACYINSDGECQIGDADAIATASCAWIATASISANATGAFLRRGLIHNSAWSWTAGQLIYLTVTGTTGNTLSASPVSGEDDVVQILAQAMSAHVINWSPNLAQTEYKV